MRRAYGVQPPAPLHVLVPAHSLAGSCPFGTVEQVPGVMLQATQRVEQLELQQKPSTQAPLPHCAAEVHSEPFAARQSPVWQIPLWQSVAPAQP